MFIKKITFSSVLGIAVVIALFVGISFFARHYDEAIHSLIGADSVWGMLFYILITMAAIVVAPLSTIPLVPLASNIWGWKLAGLLYTIGLALGSYIAFVIARYFGKPLVSKIVSIEKIEKMARQIPQKNIFWVVVALRMVIPVDMLSYALGLFSRIKQIPYMTATVIGIIPTAFLLSYAGTLPAGYQVGLLAFLLLVFAAALWRINK